MEQIEMILKQKTSDLVNKVKTSYESLISYVLVSIAFSLVFMGFIPWLLGQDGPVYHWPTTFDRALNMLVIVVLGLTFIFFYWVKYKAIATVFEGPDIKQGLIRNIEKLRNAFMHEVIYVIALFMGWFTIARFHSQVAGYGEFWDILHPDILLAIGAMTIFLGSYLIVRYRLYKKYISELKGYLEEFEKA